MSSSEASSLLSTPSISELSRPSSADAPHDIPRSFLYFINTLLLQIIFFAIIYFAILSIIFAASSLFVPRELSANFYFLLLIEPFVLSAITVLPIRVLLGVVRKSSRLSSSTRLSRLTYPLTLPATNLSTIPRTNFSELTDYRSFIANNLNERIARLRSRSEFILVSIAASLMGAAIVIIAAGNLTSIDDNAASIIEKLNSEMDGARRLLSARQEQLSLLGQLKTADTSKQADIRKSLGQFTNPNLTEEQLTSQISVENQRLVDRGADYKNAWAKEIDKDKGYADWHFIVATAVTRFGVVLVVIFLVQILVGLYRYNVRLATNYTSLLYLIAAWDGKPSSLNTLLKVFRPPEIDFGKMPRSAYEEMATILANKIGDQFGKSAGNSRASKGKKEE